MSINHHHANLLVGPSDSAEEYLHSLCAGFGIETRGNPDFFALKSDVLGIDEARSISALAARKPFGRNPKIFLLSPSRITAEAQNALLKTFEEPSSETIFFLVARVEGAIIPTLLSRMQKVNLGGGAATNEFLSLPLKKRLSYAKEFAEEGRDLPSFLDSVLSVVSSEDAKKVFNISRVAHNRNLSARLAIEHLALVLP